MKQATPAWMWILVVAVGVGLGLGLRPLMQSLLQGGGASGPQTPSVRCVGPAGSELALSEFIQNSLSGTDVTYSRSYLLERPGQGALQFSAGTPDKDSAPIHCANVRFGPGPRISFSRGRSVNVVELVGPVVNTWEASSDKDLTAIVLEPRWKLGLKLEDYAASAPVIAEDGKSGRVELRRLTTNPGFPACFAFTTTNAGVTWALAKGECTQ